MSRHMIVIEGYRYPDGRVLEFDSVLVEQNLPVPVVIQSIASGRNELVGTATDLQRDDTTGEITMEIKTKEDLTNMTPQAFFLPYEADQTPEGLSVTRAVLREVTFVEG